MLFNLRNWGSVIPFVKETFLRFPLVLLCALGATFLALLMVHHVELINKSNLVKIYSTLIFATIGLTSLKLLVESEKWSVTKYTMGVVIVLAVIVLFVWTVFIEKTASTYLFFSLALTTSLLIAPYINRESTQASFWYFNYKTGVAVFFAVVATIVLGAGVSLSLLSIGYLFEVKIYSKLYADIWVMSWGILFTVYLLANIAKEFDFEEENCSFPKGISFITNYILVPLMWAYMAILYAYFFKIIIQWELPRGNMGWVITAFGSIGILTKLLAYPIRNDGTRLLVLFDKYYYYALIVPIILLGVAIGVRINNYGITESRYAVILLGIWFTLVTLLTVIKKDRFHIKYVPILFAILAFFASFGPWGAVEMSINSQVSRFESVLIKNNLLVNGQAVKLQGDLSFTERKTISSIADYLTVNDNRFKRIKPWFKTLLSESGTDEITTKRRRGSKDLIGLMGVDYLNRWNGKNTKQLNSFTYGAGNTNLSKAMINVSGYDFVGRGYLYTKSKAKIKLYKFKHNEKNKVLKLTGTNQSVIVQIDDGEQVKYDIANVVRELRDKKENMITPANKVKLTLTQSSTGGDVKIQLRLEKIQGKVTADNKIDISTVRYFIMLKFVKRDTL